MPFSGADQGHPYHYEMDFDALNRAMEDAHLTGSDLARLTGLDQSGISALRNGRSRNPSAARLLLICDALDMDPIDLMRRVDEE